MNARSTAFPRTVRLTEAADYQRVFKKSRQRAGDRTLTLLAIPNEHGHGRLGLAISRKSARRAVDRNRIKRVIRESFRHHLDSMAPLDIVVISRAGIEKCSNAELFAALEKFWARLSQSCKSS